MIENKANNFLIYCSCKKKKFWYYLIKHVKRNKKRWEKYGNMRSRKGIWESGYFYHKKKKKKFDEEEKRERDC